MKPHSVLIPAAMLVFSLSVHTAFTADSTACASPPPPGSPSRLYRDGSLLCWNGQPLRMIGYGAIDLATRDGYDSSRFLNTVRWVDSSSPSKRHGANLTRIWALGSANFPDCYHTPADLDPAQPPTTMPFQLMPGERCSASHPYPRYNMCISDVACREGVGLNPAYVSRLQDILTQARQNGIIVELMLFDAYFLGKHNDFGALYAKNPWNPLNNNMKLNNFRGSPGAGLFSSCNLLYTSTDPMDLSADAFPQFYNICADTSSTARCDKTLNCLGLIQKAYVQSMVQLVRNNPGGSDNVFFEIMNRATFDKLDSHGEGFDLANFKRWTDVVGYWIKCGGNKNCSSVAGNYLVLAEVGLAEFQDLACTNRARCPVNPTDVFAMPNIDIINIQGYTWDNSPGAPGPCQTAKVAISKFNKPAIIDTDSAFERVDKCNVAHWAREIAACGQPGQVHLDQLDGMTFHGATPRLCTFRGIGSPQLFVDYDGMYVDCFTLDVLGDGNATFLSDIATTTPPASCVNSVTSTGQPTWCSATCPGR